MSDILNDPDYGLIGDRRDIPLSLGCVVMGWNACELGMRGLIRTLATRRSLETWRLAEILISELGTLALTQALRCYADEFPENAGDLAEAVKHIAECSERHKAYRNYYVHGIYVASGIGFSFTDENLDNDVPLSQCLIPGPFGHIYQKSAKGRAKFIMDFIKAGELVRLSNELMGLRDYIHAVDSSLIHYLTGSDFRQTAPLPEPPPLPSVLAKPELRHPRLRSQPSLVPDETLSEEGE